MADITHDVIVVGAGIMGSATAWELTRRGRTVLLLEQFDFLHRRGSSHGESRIIRRTYPQDYYTKMMELSYNLWEEAQQEAGVRVYTQTGGLDFGRRNNAEVQGLIRSCEVHKVEHEVLTAAAAMDRFPQLRLPDDHVAIYSPAAGVLNATKAVAMFQRLATARGATLRDRIKIEHIGTKRLVDGSTGVEVLANDGRTVFAGKKCVIAAGAWSKSLFKKIAGVEVPVEPLHTTVAYWRTIGTDGFSAAKGFPVFINYEQPALIYGMPCLEFPGLLKAAFHLGPLCDPDARAPEPLLADVHKYVVPFLREKFGSAVRTDAPALAEGCMYSMTPDEDFILDFLPLPDQPKQKGPILVAAGFSGHGFKFGPLIGKIMADLATTGKCPEVPLHRFALGRFESKPSVELPRGEEVEELLARRARL
ncbi:sarcosine oxidase [Klebsormidium nitens]|uniref:sarcosine oxidasee (formaldehyde-forming) n=1 Tax=Klebsormidium nitens TaxID=105231 RepID=A0A1Y1IKN2_KLENI|nr:sarcosine oxidase [Klebsormidium nitens]|eukprot:GAQ89326.1 sarcosine oxidase [Klebsormidium nitens]